MIAAAPPFFALRMALFYAGYLSVTGKTLPFFPVWLAYRGFSPGDISFALTLQIVLLVLAQPAASLFADRGPAAGLRSVC